MSELSECGYGAGKWGDNRAWCSRIGYHIIKYRRRVGVGAFGMMNDDIISSQEQSLKTEKYTES
jgi:hypothetical protein